MGRKPFLTDQDRLEYSQRYAHERKADRETWPHASIIKIRYRAKLKGIPFDIDASDIIIPDVCPILLTSFVMVAPLHPYSPSVDRVIPELGYVKGNVRVISRLANTMKQNITDPEAFRRLADYLETHCS